MYYNLDDLDSTELNEFYMELAFRELALVLGINFPNLKGLTVLEIAAENGWLTRKLVDLFKHVVAIDPVLSLHENYDNLTKQNYYFNHSYDCSNYNLLLSCRPCGIDEDIICASKQYHIPFFITLCRCPHGFETNEKRYLYLQSIAPKNTKLYCKDTIWYLTNLNRT